jgi:heme O synthase-like polyprenyltransferase
LFHQPQAVDLARSVFKYSIVYLLLLYLGMGLDRWPLLHTWQQVWVQKAIHWWG